MTVVLFISLILFKKTLLFVLAYCIQVGIDIVQKKIKLRRVGIANIVI
jgi:hypothetical protein